MKRVLFAVGNWLIDLGITIRELGEAVSHARSHPTDLQNR